MLDPVFVNRILNMKKIKFIGLDMDHTLIRYHTKAFEKVVYQLVVARLVATEKYPADISKFTFNFDQAIRGLVIDSKNGNILKLSRFAAIRQSYHGTFPINFVDQQTIYRSTYVDLGDPNYMVIDTAFSIAFCVLYGQLVDYKDQAIAHQLPNYQEMALDVLHMVDLIHADGSLKSIISQHLDDYVIKDAAVVSGLQRYMRYGKKLFIVTNSEYYYSKLLLDYAINPFLTDGLTWRNLFEFVITSADKPRFFYDNLKFLKINPRNGSMHNCLGIIVPGVYQGGNAKKFTDDLNLNGYEILYIGDHIYGDVLRLKKDCNWRTALVVEELGSEIEGQLQALPTEKKITVAMQEKIDLEQQYTELCSKRIDESTHRYDKPIGLLQKQINILDNQITMFLQEQHKFFNPYWDRVFRAGAEESYFAYQVERYACVYTEKLFNLLNHSPINYFRANRRVLAHDAN